MSLPCDNCGQSGYRVNKVRLWTTISRKRGESIVTERRLCHWSQPETLTRRAMIAVESRVLSVREANKVRKAANG